MTATRTLIYLHGLGSSPLSAKARFIRDYFIPRGIAVVTPDLNIPSFGELSPTLAVEAVVESLRSHLQDRAILVGSSFGGLLAVHALDRLVESERQQIDRLILLAPALYPWHPGGNLLSPEVEATWSSQGAMPLMDYTTGQNVPVHYSFVEELRSLDSGRAIPATPTLLIHGTRDQVVAPEQSEMFCKVCPHATLMLVEDGHSLLADPDSWLDAMWDFVAGRGDHC